MGIISIIIFVFFGFIALGLFGLLCKVVGFIFELLLEGISEGLGCLCWIIAIFILFAVLL